MGREIMPMHRRFAIEGEACVRGSDIHQTGLAGMPCDLRTVVMYFSKGRARPHLGAKRVLEEQVLEIGQQQFLMLLFMIEAQRSEEHTSELQSLMRISSAVFC